MYHFIETITNRAGDALAGRYVRLRSGDTYATLYSDASGTPIIEASGIDDAARSSVLGRISAYVEDGDYSVEIYDTDGITLVDTIPSVPMYGFDTETLANVEAASGFADTASAAAETATAAAAIASQASAYTEEFSAPSYVDTAAGVAATAIGRFFRVAIPATDPVEYTRYERTASDPFYVEAAPLATTAALASDAGAGLIDYNSFPTIFTRRRLDDHIAERGISVFESDDVRTTWESGTASMSQELSAILLRAEEAASANGERSFVRFPPALRKNGAWVPGQYLLKGAGGTDANPGELRLRDNLIVDARGAYFKHDAASNIGHMLVSRGAQNTDWYGGTLDGNEAVNCNPVAVSWRDPFYGAQRNSSRLRFFDIIAMNARHGGAHLPDTTDPQYIGRGGGKPFSVQNGAEDIEFNNCSAYDCDLGIDIGGITSNDRWAQNIRFNNTYLQDIRYMGLFAGGTSSGTPAAGSAVSAMLTGLYMRDVGIGLTADGSPEDVANLFGAITTNGVFAMLINGFYLENTSGKTTVKRGTNRNCQIKNFVAHVNGTLVNGFNSEPFGGDDPREVDSYGNEYDGTIFLNGSAEPSGVIWRNGTTYEEQNTVAKIRVKRHNNNTPAKLSTSKMFNNLHAGNDVEIKDLYDNSIHHAYKGQVRTTPETTTNVADDTVLTYIPRNTDTTVRVTCDTGSTIHAATIDIKGARVIKDPDTDSAGNFVVGTTALTDGTSDGTDGKYNVNYVAASGIVYFKNRFNASRNVTIREFV